MHHSAPGCLLWGLAQRLPGCCSSCHLLTVTFLLPEALTHRTQSPAPEGQGEAIDLHRSPGLPPKADVPAHLHMPGAGSLPCLWEERPSPGTSPDAGPASSSAAEAGVPRGAGPRRRRVPVPARPCCLSHVGSSQLRSRRLTRHRLPGPWVPAGFSQWKERGAGGLPAGSWGHSSCWYQSTAPSRWVP